MCVHAEAKDVVAAQKGAPKGSGNYVRGITAANKYDPTDMTFENGVFFGPLGSLTFKGPFKLDEVRQQCACVSPQCELKLTHLLGVCFHFSHVRRKLGASW